MCKVFCFLFLQQIASRETHVVLTHLYKSPISTKIPTAAVCCLTWVNRTPVCTSLPSCAILSHVFLFFSISSSLYACFKLCLLIYVLYTGQLSSCSMWAHTYWQDLLVPVKESGSCPTLHHRHAHHKLISWLQLFSENSLFAWMLIRHSDWLRHFIPYLFNKSRIKIQCMRPRGNKGQHYKHCQMMTNRVMCWCLVFICSQNLLFNVLLTTRTERWSVITMFLFWLITH